LSFLPFGLEDSLDPWLEVEPDELRRRAVVEFLIELCDHDGELGDAEPIANQPLPSYVKAVPGTGVVVVWVVVAQYRQVVVRYLYDLADGTWYPPRPRPR
jgi:hypothetical protein